MAARRNEPAMPVARCFAGESWPAEAATSTKLGARERRIFSGTVQTSRRKFCDRP
jgi:hypothetical protein